MILYQGNTGVRYFNIDFSSCRFWSRFLPTLKRFTVLELKATLRGIAMRSSFLVSTHACDPSVTFNVYGFGKKEAMNVYTV